MDLLIILFVGVLGVIGAFYGRIREEGKHIDQLTGHTDSSDSSDSSHALPSEKVTHVPA